MDAMPGDAEAAGAVAGMIETTGAKPTRRLWDAFVGYEWGGNGRPYAFNYVIYSIDDVTGDITLPCGARLCRNNWTGHVEVMPTERFQRLHDSKAKAYVHVIEELLERREKISADIQRLKEALADEIAREEGDR